MKTITQQSYLLLCFLFVASVFTACTKEDTCENGLSGDNCDIIEFSPSDDIQALLQTALITVEDGQTIYLKAGNYVFTSTLSIEGKKNVTIKGDGQEQTILSFAGQTAGAEALKANDMEQFLMHDFKIEDSAGDAIKVKDSDGVSFINLSTVWTGEANEENGAYGLYPVSSTHVLIDNCYVRGASDAGIYVGQTEHVIVRNSTVEENVAGIEIENCNYADVYNNTATRNTGGVLIFDMPNLPLKNGVQCRVFDNNIYQNDYRNFAPEGNIVGSVPSGTGIMIMTSKQVEVFNNEITNNNVMGIGIVSYLVLEFFDDNLSYSDDEYVPYVDNINIHNNAFSRTTTYPEFQNTIGVLLQNLYAQGDMPDIIYDGIFNPDLADVENKGICIAGNGDATFANVDAENFFQNQSYDMLPHSCPQDPLPEVPVNPPTTK